MGSLWSSIMEFISGSFICGICFEKFNKHELISFPNCVDQLHFYCRSCMIQYLKNKIERGVINIPCPQFLCSSIISSKEINELVPAESQKHERFKRMKDNSNFRECHACNREMIFNTSVNETIKTCSCGITSCFTHGGAHRGRTCKEYESSIEQDSAALIKRVCKRCPRCGVPIEKVDGCDHMFCTQCHTNWSWIFGNIYKL